MHTPKTKALEGHVAEAGLDLGRERQEEAPCARLADQGTSWLSHKSRCSRGRRAAEPGAGARGAGTLERFIKGIKGGRKREHEV